MSRIVKKFISSNAVDGTKIRLSNNEYLRARNAADSADVNIAKVNASDKIEFASVPQVTSDASAANDLVRKSQLDASLQGLKPKEAVRAASTANVVIASALEDGDVIDGVTLATGDRVLLKNQTDPTENGIYVVVASGAASRSLDLDASSEFLGSYTLTREGTANAGVGYVCTVSSSFVLGTDDVTFIQFSSAGAVIGGDMITVSGSTISVDLATTSGLESTNPGNAAGQLRVKLEASNPTIQIDGSNQLGVKYDSSKALTTSASGLQVAVAAVSALQFSSNALAVKLEASNPTLQIDGSNQLGVKFSATTSALQATASGLAVQTEASNPTLAIDGSNQLGVKYDSTKGLATSASGLLVSLDVAGALEFNAGAIRSRVDAATVKINGSNQLESTKALAEAITLSGTDITNQYVDLAHTARASAAIMLSVDGAPIQERGVDYTVSLAGGSGGVTRITFAGDLATGGAAELLSGDKLLVCYDYL